ncbi:MAG: hypothetical protein QOF60_2550 [Actinomycetota bacterium]|jgi:hypothetical protein|nr:hypothetical protein [Actinomycetota bacterium]
MSTRTLLGLLGLLAAATAAASLLVGAWLFPLGSANRDESSYQAFASMLRHGHATLPLADRPYRPWASGVRMGRVVMKYTPPWPLALALATSAVGEPRAASALAAAAAVLLVYALARELLADDRRALLAALLFAASPFVIVQSATTLAYVFQLALELAAAVLLLRSCHTPVISPHPGGAPKIAPTIRAPANGRRATWSLAAAGALTGVAVFARPFDAVLFVGPFAALTFWPRARWKGAAWFAAGAAVPLIAFLAYNVATMGSPLSLPFQVTGPTDGFGFGDRGIFANGTVKFTFANGIEGTAADLGWLVAWAAGGPFLVVLAANGMRRHWRDQRAVARALLVTTVAYPIAYLAFWGTYAVAHYWRGAATLGPFYHLPVLVPLVILAAAGWPKAKHAAVAIAMAAVTLAWLPVKVADNQRVTAAYRRAQRAAARVEQPAVLLIADHGDRGYDSWTPFLANGTDLDRQPVVYAEDRPATNFAVADRYANGPGARHLARLVTSPAPTAPAKFRVVPIEVTRAQTVTASIRWTRAVDFAYLVDHGHEQRRATDQRTTQWQLGPDDLRQAKGTLALGVQQGKRRWEVRVPYRIVDGNVEVIGPGRGYERRGRMWREADVSATITDRYGV